MARVTVKEAAKMAWPAGVEAGIEACIARLRAAIAHGHDELSIVDAADLLESWKPRGVAKAREAAEERARTA